MSTPLWRQVMEGTYDPFASSFDRRSSGTTGFEGLQTDWRAFQMEEDAQAAAQRQLEQEERAALEARGEEYVNLQQAQARRDTAVDTAAAFGQPGIQPSVPATALEGIAGVLDAAKSAVVGGLSGLMGWDIQGEEIDETKIGTSRFTRREDIVGDRNRLEVAWERALKGLLGGQSYGFGDFEALRYDQDDPRFERVTKGLGAFLLDTAFDPLTYFSFGSSVLGRTVASTGVRQISRTVGREVLEAAGEQAARDQVERLGVRELATRVSTSSGKKFEDLLVRTPQQLADDLLAASKDDFMEAAVESWSFGNAAAYGARGRTGLYDRLVSTVGQDLADSTWQKIPLDLRGGARFRVPFARTTDTATGLRLPTVLAFPGSNPGRGFDKLGMGNIVRRMNQARLVARTGPFKFVEHVSGGRGRSWTRVLQAARNGDGEAIEAYAIHFGTMAFDDAYRVQAAAYDQMVGAGMQAIGRQISAATEQGIDQDEIIDFARELYFKRGRSDVPTPSSPAHVIAVDIADRMFEMTDNTHKMAVEIYGEDAARKMEDYATRMLSDDGFKDLVERYGRLEGRRGSLSEGDGRLITSYPKSMDIDSQGRLVVTEWMTPDEIKQRTGQNLFISDPIEAVGEYLIMMRRELMRDWSLKKLDELGLLKSIGEDVIRQPTVRKIQSEVHPRLLKIRAMLDKIEKGEPLDELEQISLDADRAAMQTIQMSGQLVEVEPDVWRSGDGMVEIRRNRSGGYSASVAGEPVLRPTVSQMQAEELVPELQGPVREVDWDEVRSGFYDAEGNRIPARQVRMEGVDDPRWVTSEPPPSPVRRFGRAVRVVPEVDDSREISGTWEPWLKSGFDADLEYVHKVLRHRISTYENGGRSVSRQAYNIHKRDLEILEELHPHLRNMTYDDVPTPASSSLPRQKYRIEQGPDGSWRIVENLEAGEAGVTIVSRANDTFQLSNGKSLSVQKAGDFWEVTEVDPSTGLASVIMRGTNKKQLIADVLERFPRGEAPTPSAAGAVDLSGVPALRTRDDFVAELEDVELSWSKVGRNHVAYYNDFEITISTAPKDSQSKYVVKVTGPDGRSSSDSTYTNLANTKDLVKRFFLAPEMERFSFRARERAIREAIGDGAEWPGLSLAEDSFIKYSSSTRAALVDFGDGSSLEIVWNGETWLASRLIDGKHFLHDDPFVAAASDWDGFVDELDGLYPGVKRVLDEELPGRPVGQAGGVVTFDDAVVPTATTADVRLQEILQEELRSRARVDYQVEDGIDRLEVGNYSVEIVQIRNNYIPDWQIRVFSGDELQREAVRKTDRRSARFEAASELADFLATLPPEEISRATGLDLSEFAPKRAPQVPSAPDRPAWELTPEEFEASGRTLLHGTPQEFDFFDSMESTVRGRGGRPSATGRRFYFTDDPNVAGEFRQNVSPVDVDEWLNRTDFDLADLEDPQVFALFSQDVNASLQRRNAKLQAMDDSGDWVDMDPDDLTFETIQLETPLRAVSDRGQVIETRVFGREVDLTGDLSGQPEELLEALRLDGILDTSTGKPRILGYTFSHERRFENTAAWMRENGYGRAVVPDAPESGGRSYIGLEEYIEYGRTPQDVYEQVTAGRVSPEPVEAAPEPAPIKPGLKREFAGRYKYTRETGEQFDIEQVRPDGGAQVWRVTDAEGIDLGDFPRREDAVAFLEGRPPAAPRQTMPPETRALVAQIRQTMREMAAKGVEAEDWDDMTAFMLNAIEILAFDQPALARRLAVKFAEDVGSPDVAAVISDVIEDVVAKAPAPRPTPGAATQQAAGVAPGVGGGTVLTPPAPRPDFIDRDEAAYWANRLANKVREPRVRVVRDEVWERNKAELVAKLQEDRQWLEASLEDGLLLQGMDEESFEEWVERVTSFLRGVDPSIDPFDKAIDKRRYSRAAAEAGIERFSTAGVDPVVAAIIRDNDLFGPEILRDTILRHFSLARNLDGAESFYQNFWRPYYTASKSWMTQGRGYGYTARNIIGSMYNAWLADVRARHFKYSGAMLAARRNAREEADKILERRGVQEGETTVEAWERIFDTELRRFLREGVGGFNGLRDDVADLVADAYQLFTDRNYGGRTARSRTWGDILDRGEFDSPVYEVASAGRRAAELFPGRTIDELTRAQRIANVSIDNPWMRHVTRVNESAEDYLRFAAFLRGIDTYGIEDGGFAAGTWVVGTQFDYSNLSDFERRVMKNIVPFYTWTRYNVPLQIRSVWMEPGKVNRLLRFHEEVMKAWTGESKEDEQSLPEWLRRRGGWMTTMSTPFTDPESALGEVFGLKEDPIAAFIESPLSDLGMLFNATLNPLQILNTDEVINNLNPIVGRTAYEFLTGRSYVSGRELDSDAEAPRWAVPWAWARNRRNDDGELVFSQKWAQTFRNLLPPFAQVERLLAPLIGDERQRRRWLTTVGSQVLATPLYTVDPNQQAFAISTYAQGIQDALDDGIINYEDRRDVARRLLDMGYEPEQIRELGLSQADPASFNFDELARARRNVAAEDQIARFLETLPPGSAEQFIFRRGFRGKTGAEAVEAWRNRAPINELGALALPEVDLAFADWFGRLTESDKLGFVFRYGYGPYRGAEAVQQWSVSGGLPNRPAGMGSADFLAEGP